MGGRKVGSLTKRTGNFHTQREKKFVKKLVETSEIGKAAVLAGYADPSYGSKLMREPRILTEIQKALAKEGIHEGYIARKIKEGLEAVYPKKYAANGQLVQDNEPDFFTQSVWMDKLLRIRGDYAPERFESVSKSIELKLDLTLVKGLKDAGAITDVEAAELIGEEKPEELPAPTEEKENGS